MEILSNNDVKVQRNETFTFDKTIKFKNGFPLIISKDQTTFPNPYILLTISDANYSQDDRYILNKWLSLENFPKFSLTVPYDIRKFYRMNSEDKVYLTGFSDITELVNGHVIENYIYDETDKIMSLSPSDAVFYELNDGVIECKYWNTEVNNWRDYSFRIVTSFLQELTEKWVGQSYLYSIFVVSGRTMLAYLREVAISANMDINGKTQEELFREIKTYEQNNNVKLLGEKINEYSCLRPIAPPYRNFIPVLEQKKWTVSSDLHGGI